MTLPDREALHAAFVAAVEELQSHRPPDAAVLTTGYNRTVGEAVFTGCWLALNGTDRPKPRMQVISAPMGTGKSSAAVAFAAALVRSANLPSLLLVSDIKAAERFYSELKLLLPGQVCVWSTDHDAASRQAPKQVTHADRARYFVEDLQHHPVVIVTTNFYAGKRGHKARTYLRDGQAVDRLTIIDEQPKEVDTYDLTLTHAAAVQGAVELLEDHKGALPPLNTLVHFMTDRACAESGASLEKPDEWRLSPELQWFASSAAKQFAARHQNILGPREQDREQVSAVFGFARALSTSWAFIERFGSKGTRFVGYEVAFDLPAGAVLRDATGDIDGRTQICPGRSAVYVPPASFENLDIAHVEPLTRQRLNTFLATPKGRADYASFMMDTIRANMQPGQRALVVCKKFLIEQEAIPAWPARDPRFSNTQAFTDDYGWELDGRWL